MTTPNTNLPVAGHPSNATALDVTHHPSARPKTRGKWRGFGLFSAAIWGHASSAISSDFTIEGNVRCNGHARLDGAVFGNVVCKDLVVGQNGHIVGDIKAETIIVHGAVNGTVFCRKASLKSGSSIEGDIFHEDLAIEVGARFAGKSIRLHDGEQPDDSPEGDTQGEPLSRRA